MTTSRFLPPRLRHAAAVLHAGGVIAYPTEGVYGLGCRPDDARAVEFLLELKERPVSAGLILIAADLEQLDGWIAPTPAEARRLLAPPGPGPVTWLVTAGPLAPTWVTGGRDTVAVRVTQPPGGGRLVPGCRPAAGIDQRQPQRQAARPLGPGRAAALWQAPGSGRWRSARRPFRTVGNSARGVR